MAVFRLHLFIQLFCLYKNIAYRLYPENYLLELYLQANSLINFRMIKDVIILGLLYVKQYTMILQFIADFFHHERKSTKRFGKSVSYL